MTSYSDEQISAIKQEAKESLLENLSSIMTRKDTSTSHASRKPPIFKYGDDFNSYLETWSNYARILNIPEADRGRLLFTYLDSESNEKVNTLKLTSEQKNTWPDLKQNLRKILDPDSKQQARAKLFSMKQLPSESCEEFGRKLQRMASKAYDENTETAARDANVRDIFIYGLLNNSIAIHLMNNKKTDFPSLYQDALELEKNLEARKQVSGGPEIEILKIEAPKREMVKNDKITGNCFNCGKNGHWAANCKAPKVSKKICHYCNKVGHIKPNCFKYRNDHNYNYKPFVNARNGAGASNFDRRQFHNSRPFPSRPFHNSRPFESRPSQHLAMNNNLGNSQAPHMRK